MKKITALILALAMLLCGCAGGKSSSAAAGAEAPKELREVDVVLDWYPNALHAFIYTAIEKGYYADEGLKVNVRFPSGTNDALSLVAAGRAQLGVYYQQDVVVTRINQSVPVKAIGAIVQSPLNIVLSLKEENITVPADLEGKKIGYAGTELSEAIIHTMMEKAGVDPSSVDMVDVGFDLMSSMTTKKVNATIGCLLNHEVPQMEEEGFEVNYMRPEECGIPNYYEAMFIASDDSINNDADMLKAFLRASAKGFADMKADPAASLKILMDNQNVENFPLSESVEKCSMEVLLPLMENEKNAFLSQDEAVWQENIDWLYSEGLIKEKRPATDFYVTLE